MLNGWSNFFTMTGAAGATLVGLLFVVVTLGTGMSIATDASGNGKYALGS